MAEIYVIVMTKPNGSVVQVFATTNRNDLARSLNSWLDKRGWPLSLTSYCRENKLLCSGEFRIPDALVYENED